MTVAVGCWQHMINNAKMLELDKFQARYRDQGLGMGCRVLGAGLLDWALAVN